MKRNDEHKPVTCEKKQTQPRGANQKRLMERLAGGMKASSGMEGKRGTDPK